MDMVHMTNMSGDDPKQGCFCVAGLAPGMGAVVGTAMRRVLLSSVPGGGVVWMRVEGVPHEFSTVPGVREDVPEILQNVKKLILRVSDDEIHTLHLKVQGHDAIAAELTGDGGAEVINPDLVLAHVAPGAELELELWCCRGRDNDHTRRGLLPDGTGERRRIPAGMIAVDSVFSPVERVSLEVEELPDSDSFCLTVCTNGAVTPQQAVATAAKILTELLNTVERVNVPEPIPEVQKQAGDSLLCLGLSKRAYNRLRRAKLNSVEQVMEHTSEELYAIPDLGPSTILELQTRLAKNGLILRRNVRS